jgi:hypothetical protein
MGRAKRNPSSFRARTGGFRGACHRAALRADPVALPTLHIFYDGSLWQCPLRHCRPGWHPMLLITPPPNRCGPQTPPSPDRPIPDEPPPPDAGTLHMPRVQTAPRREQSLLTLQNSNRHCLTPKKPVWQLWPAGQFAVVRHGVKPTWPDAAAGRASISKAKAMERRVCVSSSQSTKGTALANTIAGQTPVKGSDRGVRWRGVANSAPAGIVPSANPPYGSENQKYPLDYSANQNYIPPQPEPP